MARLATAAVSGTILLLIGPVAAAQSATKTFSYTGHEQAFVVPAGVSELEVLAVGAQGGGASGGVGASVSGTIAVSGSETLYIEVGGAGFTGTVPTTAFNGGAAGGFVPGAGAGTGGGGGGASDVRSVSMVPSDSPLSLDSRLMVAAGGGGGGGYGTDGYPANVGGAGGGAGSDGASSEAGTAHGGHGATAAAPGAKGIGNGSGSDGSDGGVGSGGTGGSGDGLAAGGGGGGGGLYGGGGGGGDEGGFDGGGGGGGGSSLVPTGGTSSLATTNQAAQVQITYQPPSPPLPTAEPDTKIIKATIKRKKHRAKFSFEAVGHATGFECKLIKAGRKKNPGFSACESAKVYKKLKAGSYIFEVRARNGQSVDRTPSIRSFTI